MAFFWNRRRAPWTLASAEPPWGQRPSIHGHLRAHIVPGHRGLTDGGEDLPDEEPPQGDTLRWVAGGLDGVVSHHGGDETGGAAATVLDEALRAVLRDVTTPNLARLYGLLLQEHTVEYIDGFLASLASWSARDIDRLAALAEWIATHAADREPVKWAIGVLSLAPTPATEDILNTLGRHDELTLHVAAALQRTAADPQRALFELAQHVHGWGRIQIVERLAESPTPEIARWLLREGYKNSVMHEYLAHTCATAGGLRAELEADTIDDALRAGTEDLLRALFDLGGPAANMLDFEDGPIVVTRYLHHLGAAPTRLESLLVVGLVRDFLVRDFLARARDWTDPRLEGWTPERRAALQVRCDALIALPHWRDAVRPGLESPDDAAFRLADAAARLLGIDTWETHRRRLETGATGGSWYWLLQTADPERIDRAVALAERTMPLHRIASGPARELGAGPEWRTWSAHHDLDFVLQELRRFPGKGWTLLQAGLASPLLSNRHKTLQALAAWGKERWPAETAARLHQALEVEVDDGVREEIRAVLEGKAGRFA